VFGRAEGFALNFDEREHYIDLTAAEIRTSSASGRRSAAIDFGSWRFMFLGFAVDTKGRVIRIAEVFSQREEALGAREADPRRVRAAGIIKGDQLAIARFPVWAIRPARRISSS
jgi:hypothetical protein